MSRLNKRKSFGGFVAERKRNSDGNDNPIGALRREAWQNFSSASEVIDDGSTEYKPSKEQTASAAAHTQETESIPSLELIKSEPALSDQHSFELLLLVRGIKYHRENINIQPLKDFSLHREPEYVFGT